MSVFVTGGTGFLGKNLVRELVRRGERVRMLARDPARARDVAGPAVEVVPGDLVDTDAVRRGLDGCDRVFHAASLVKEWVRDPSIFDRVNVDAFGRLLDAARAAGVKRVVYTSSFMAIGRTDRLPTGVADETVEHEADHFHNAYERTKAEALRVASRAAAGGLPIVVTVPGVIYGPGEITEGNIVVRMLRDLLRHRLPGIPGDGSRQWSFAYVDDVVRGHLLAMEKGRVGERYVLGGENVTMNRFFEVIGEVTGRKPLRRHLPFGFMKAVATIEEGRARLGLGYPMLTRGFVEIQKHDWAYDSSKAVRDLGYTMTPLREGLRRTYEWMQTFR
ncbi:MAG: SDR family oxidoreductase [Planctomycetes bacterium]|nr:SDR family oxidoreductase [Planctomycetota bacterium]